MSGPSVKEISRSLVWYKNGLHYEIIHHVGTDKGVLQVINYVPLRDENIKKLSGEDDDKILSEGLNSYGNLLNNLPTTFDKSMLATKIRIKYQNLNETTRPKSIAALKDIYKRLEQIGGKRRSQTKRPVSLHKKRLSKSRKTRKSRKSRKSQKSQKSRKSRKSQKSLKSRKTHSG
jgi:hypothetical protein